MNTPTIILLVLWFLMVGVVLQVIAKRKHLDFNYDHAWVVPMIIAVVGFLSLLSIFAPVRGVVEVKDLPELKYTRFAIEDKHYVAYVRFEDEVVTIRRLQNSEGGEVVPQMHYYSSLFGYTQAKTSYEFPNK